MAPDENWTLLQKEFYFYSRRNLSFDDSSLRRTTPRKKMSLATPKKGSKTPKKTPKKNGTGRFLLYNFRIP